MNRIILTTALTLVSSLACTPNLALGGTVTPDASPLRLVVDDSDHVSRLLPPTVEDIVVIFPDRLSRSPVVTEGYGALAQTPVGAFANDIDRVLSVCDVELDRIERIVFGIVDDQDNWVMVVDYPGFVDDDGAVIYDRLSCMAAGLRVLTAGVIEPSVDEAALHFRPRTREELAWLPTYGVLRLIPSNRLLLSSSGIDHDIEQLLTDEHAQHAPEHVFSAVEGHRDACLHVSLGGYLEHGNSEENPGPTSLAMTVECSDQDLYSLFLSLEMASPESAHETGVELVMAWPELLSELQVSLENRTIHAQTTMPGLSLKMLIAMLLAS